MPRTAEIDYYSNLLASLTITAARAKTEAALREVHEQLAAAHAEILTLLSHDAGALRAELLERSS